MSFSEQVCFTPQFEPDFPVFSEKSDRLKQLHQGIVELESEAAQVRQKLRDLNSRAISALEDTSTPDRHCYRLSSQKDAIDAQRASLITQRITAG